MSTTPSKSSKEENIVAELPIITQEKKELLKRTFCKGATDDELELFLHACKRTKLDPFAKQIYFIKYGSNMSIITGIDGYRLIAERTGKYIPGRDSTFVYKDNKIFSCTSYIKKMAPDGSWHEVAATAIFDEYCPQRASTFWQSKPHIMISKCSEALALRKAFPADLSGIYTEEEMHQAEYSQISKEPILEVVDPVKILLKDVLEIENIIDSQITPVDPEFKKRALEYMKVSSLSQLTEEQGVIMKKYITKTLAALSQPKSEQTA